MKRDIFQAIADPTRRDILLLLSKKKMTPNAISGQFPTSRQAISKHIKILIECELLEQEKAGREIYYYFDSRKMKEVDKWIGKFRKQWERKFDQLDRVLNTSNKK
jgi:DNA-binding transcriptional ArsR family regulator